MEWLLGGGLSGAGALEWATPAPVVALVVVMALAALGLSQLGARPDADPRLRMAELACWALALAALVFGLAGPQWVEREGRVESARLVVLIDSSASMDIREGGEPRSAAVDELLAEVRAEAGEPIEVFHFDEELRPGPPPAYEGRGTDLHVALDAINDRYLGQDLRGVVVITDGADRGSLRRELAASAESGELSAALAPQLPGPLTLLQVGEADELFDVAVETVVTGGYAFLRTPLELRARLRGPPGFTTTVALEREGRGVDKAEITFDDNGVAETVFTIKPRKVGRFAWEVSVPELGNDAVPGNNRYPVVLRVVRERTRVLQVSGSPSYDQKFLRLFLKEDPSVDLVSFFILRTREDIDDSWEGYELSLIEFPYERLFTDELDSFDLVVLQNFNYRPYFLFNSDALLGNIAQYVREGGALVMTGGDRSFDLGDYSGTPIAEVLPVKLGVMGVKADEARFRPQLTPAGLAHPVTRLGASNETSRETWESLPPMDGLNLSRGLSPGSAALAVHPSLTTRSGEPMPVIAVREVGEGRSMALAVDASWRWSFSEAAVGRGNQAYLRFWKNALRWLVADPEDRRVVVSPSRENVLLGDDVRVGIRVRDAGYAPVEGATVTVQVRPPAGPPQEHQLTTSATGEASLELTADQRGAWRVEARAGRLAADAAETVFAVNTRDPELIDIQPDGLFLERLAAVLGDRGRHVAPGDGVDLLLDEGAERRVRAREVRSLASVPLIGLVFGIFASLAWWLRRRSGGA
jgi:uncharacterized membrane protein